MSGVTKCSVAACLPRRGQPAIARADFVCQACTAFQQSGRSQLPAFAACKYCLEHSVLHAELTAVGCPQCKQPWPMYQLLRVFGRCFINKPAVKALYCRLWRMDIEHHLRRAEACERLQATWQTLHDSLEAIRQDPYTVQAYMARALKVCRKHIKHPMVTYRLNARPATMDPQEFMDRVWQGQAPIQDDGQPNDAAAQDLGSVQHRKMLYAYCAREDCTGKLHFVTDQRERLKTLLEELPDSQRSQGTSEVSTPGLQFLAALGKTAAFRPVPFRVDASVDLPEDSTYATRTAAEAHARFVAQHSPTQPLPLIACDTCHDVVCPYCYDTVSKCEPDMPSTSPPQHVCHPETLLALAPLKSGDSRPCPRCRVLIYRSMGCAQMFCTYCHFRFNWLSGREVRGFFHNPHHSQLLDLPPDMRSALQTRAQAAAQAATDGTHQIVEGREEQQAVHEDRPAQHQQGAEQDTNNDDVNPCTDIDLEHADVAGLKCIRGVLPHPVLHSIVRSYENDCHKPVLPRHVLSPAILGVLHRLHQANVQLRSKYRNLPSDVRAHSEQLKLLYTSTRSMRDILATRADGRDGQVALLAQARKIRAGKVQRETLVRLLFWQRAKQEAYQGLLDLFTTFLHILAEGIQELNGIEAEARREWQRVTAEPLQWLRDLQSGYHNDFLATLRENWEHLRSGTLVTLSTAIRWRDLVASMLQHVPMFVSAAAATRALWTPVWDQFPEEPLPLLLPHHECQGQFLIRMVEEGRPIDVKTWFMFPTKRDHPVSLTQEAFLRKNTQYIWALLPPPAARTILLALACDEEHRHCTRAMRPVYRDVCDGPHGLGIDWKLHLQASRDRKDCKDRKDRKDRKVSCRRTVNDVIRATMTSSPPARKRQRVTRR